ncbi:MAG: RNA binding S1 domain protein [Candidatus Magasanikbacteria bacterium GW2011_GWC2_34_16]|uniref:RNA binding S1 domain protein n=2 Tax=Candidatus Magasanikiibacteriota TaxID=1752731 RepID=A0A0G0HRL5_9BACT|nr:MAG: RNA binding S1 domain protein [Candidatus Magasanikbacteria bacterium GW2011_GWC2_34_16]KKQ41245.1 MAG: RNA binding S1 domain protein [Candidatus Magasanikbacteria bacterium GW2011_GWA2_37_8]
MTEEVKKSVKQDFKTLFQTYAVNVPKVGDVVKGKVISVDKGEVRVDIEGLTTGIIRGHELFTESREYNALKAGDPVEATVIDLENENGEMELSFRIAGFQRAWDKMKKIMKDGLTIKAKVTAANKGGLMMKVEALAGFMPVSQLNPDHYPRVAGGDKNRILDKLNEMVNHDLEVKVIDVDEKEEKLIVSERAVWEDSQKAVLDTYKPGDTVSGEVSALTSFGAFIKFGEGLEGLVHISEIAWQRIDHPKDILKVGDQVKAQIIQLDHSKIYLSIKRLVDDPWKKVAEKYKIGDEVTGKIIKVEPFGLMVALDKEIHGLAHVSELSDAPIGNIHDKFKVGQEATFAVVSVEPMEHRLGLRVAGVKGKSAKKATKTDEETKPEAEPKTEEAQPEANEEKAAE